LRGDVIRLEIQGMTLKGFRNGNLLLTVTDTAFSTSNPITTTGAPGMAYRFTITYPSSYPQSVFEEWSGGNLSYAQTVTVNIDASKTFQTMQGFGTSERVFDDPHLTNTFDAATQRGAVVLSSAEQDDILDRLYVDLGLTRVRPTTGDGPIEAVNDNNDPDSTDLSKFNFGWKLNDAHIDYVKRAVTRGVNTFFLSPIKIESWFNDSNPAEYVEWAMTIMNRWKSQGVELPYYSIENEPGYAGNGASILSGAYMRDVIKILGPKMQAQGMKTKIVIPDDLNPTEAYNRASVILADPIARQYVGALATHLYGGQNLTNLKTLSDLYAIPIWMTEYSGGGGSWDKALNYASLMHGLIFDYNVTAVDYLWAYFGQWENGTADLITLNNNGSQYLGYTRQKIYYVVGQFSKFIKQGAKRIQAISSDPSVQVTSYIDGGTTTIVAINNSHNPQTTDFNLSGGKIITQINAVRSSATEDWAVLSPFNAIGSTFSAALPAKSVTTFTASTNLTAITREVEKNSIIHIYPNPAQQTFTVELPDETFDIIMIDLTGRKAYEQKNISGKIQIDSKAFSAGMYFLQATNGKIILNEKVIIAK
jgi:hypothetical protein